MNIIDFKKPGSPSIRQVHSARAPALEKVLSITLKTDAPTLMGICSDGLRSNSSILGGEFQGQNIRGSVLPGGSDFFVELSSELAFFNARFTLRTRLGELINVESKGVLLMDEEGQSELQNGIWPISEGHYQCTCTPQFQVTLGPNDWLEKSVFIGKVEYLFFNEKIMNIYRIRY
ncbi:polyribonucleotide nucleotidyltransferase [Pseudomonas floridensis]|uniref:Polyribonucleotide nucleotidyltransferase n=1 Tax=Pseudomonas floridensis TaxID=1958950 RepID=A0A1X0NA31_9PSED|nr:DUF3237 domain-containing protein [Pseudomonas floridensis]ORC60932.1 polyribonucleotide nucleotidyltransferase [Pseudomonas floridensis]